MHVKERKARFVGVLMRMMLACVLLLALGGAAVASPFALRVDGLACPFCAFGIEKKLLKVPGVVELDILLDEGKIGLTLAEGAALDLPALQEAVKQAGFTLHSLLVDGAEGRLSRDAAGNLILTSADPSATFEVSLEHVEDRDWSRETRPVAVRVSGTVMDFESRPPTLVVSEIVPQGDTRSP